MLDELVQYGLAEGDDKRPGYLDGSEIWPHLTFYLDAFFALSADRHESGPIPFSSVDRFAVRYGIDDIEEFERLRTLLRAVDDAFLVSIRPEKSVGKSGRRGKAIG